MAKKKNNEYRPNAFLWAICVPLLKIFFRIKFKIKFEKNLNKGLSGPYIVLGNHPSLLDPFVMGCGIYPDKTNFVTSKYFFINKLFNKVLKMAGCIPKTQFTVDISAIKSILKVLKNDGVIGIFLEGKSSVDGSSGLYNKTTAGLLKKMKVPVLIMKFDGAYLSKPRWSKTPMYGGYVEVSSEILFNKEDIEDLTEEEIYEQIVENMYYDDYEWNRVRKYEYKNPRLIEGLESILFKCPKCGAMFKTITSKRKIWCEECGNSGHMDSYGIIHPSGEKDIVFDTPVKWNKWQEEWMNSEILKEDFNITLNITNVKKGIELGKGFSDSGKGIVVLDNSGLKFNGTLENEEYIYELPLQSLMGISVKAESGEFELTDGKTTLLLLPEDIKKVNLFDLAINCIVKRREQNE